MRFLNFNEFKLNEEKLGVSFASLIFADFLEDRLVQKFLNFYESSEKTLKTQDNIKWWRLQNWIRTRSQDEKNRIWKIYPEFPVVGFEMILKFSKLSPISYKKKYGNVGAPVSGGGYASGFGHKNWKNYSKIVEPVRKISNVGLIIQIGLDIEYDMINFDINNPEHKSELISQIGSTIYHELNHTFEHYKRTTRLKKKDEFVKPIYDRSFNTAITYAENNIWKFPKPIWKKWRGDFLFFTYISERHELNANVQEMYYYIKKNPDRDVKSFLTYQYADQMEKFEPESFYKELIEQIKNHYWKDIVDNKELLDGSKDFEKIANRLKDMWVSVYRKECESQKAKPMASFDVFEKMSCLDFIRYWGKRFNENGKYLKRKIYAIKYEEVLKNS